MKYKAGSCAVIVVWMGLWVFLPCVCYAATESPQEKWIAKSIEGHLRYK